MRAGGKDSHKHMRNVYGPRETRLRRDSSYVRSMEDDDSLQEVGNEDEEEEGKLSDTPLEDIHKAFIGF